MTEPDRRPLILIVDDERAVSEIVAQVLADEGFRTATAFDGASALEHMGRETPGLVLLDLMMPRVDGFSVLQRMTDHVTLSRTPVLVMTGTPNPRVRSSNVVGVMKKPVTLDALVQRVGSALAGKQPMTRRIKV